MGEEDRDNNYIEVIDNKNIVNIDYDRIFDKVYGQDLEKELIIKVLKWFDNKEYYDSLNITIPKGILFHGAPGNGKTYIIKRIINNVNCPVIIYKGVSECNSEYLYKIFDDIKQYEKCILVIDELDLLLDESSENYRALQEGLDGLLTTSNVLVLSATNSVQDIPNALLRKGRFDYLIDVKNPKGEDILSYLLDTFKSLNVKLDDNIDFDSIKIMLEGLNFSDIKAIVNNVVLENGVTNIRRDQIIREIYKNNQGLLKISSDSSWFGYAMHESAHAFLNYYYKDYLKLQEVSISGIGGCTKIRFINEDFTSFKTYIADIECTLAGLVVEKVYYGDNEATLGSSNDLHDAMQQAKNLYRKYGYSKSGDTDSSNMYKSEYKLTLIDKKAERLINKLEHKTRKIVKKYIDVIVAFANILLKRVIIDGIEAFQIFDLLINNRKNMNNIVNKYLEGGIYGD